MEVACKAQGHVLLIDLPKVNDFLTIIYYHF